MIITKYLPHFIALFSITRSAPLYIRGENGLNTTTAVLVTRTESNFTTGKLNTTLGSVNFDSGSNFSSIATPNPNITIPLNDSTKSSIDQRPHYKPWWKHINQRSINIMFGIEFGYCVHLLYMILWYEIMGKLAMHLGQVLQELTDEPEHLIHYKKRLVKVLHILGMITATIPTLPSFM